MAATRLVRVAGLLYVRGLTAQEGRNRFRSTWQGLDATGMAPSFEYGPI